jgi:hypothetical protein
MEDRVYYKAERNNYFFGKLMTVRDFFNEQSYFNSKRRLGNRMLCGTGIVSGLNLFLLDNKTFSLESGMAIDYLGREIVVTEPCVSKIDTTKGFDDIKGSNIIYLCIEYKEKLSESTFSVAGNNKEKSAEKQYNRIKESYQLFLTNKEPQVDDNFSINSLAWQKIKIYEKDGIRLMISAPRYVSPQKKFKIKIYFEKEKVEFPVEYSFEIIGDFVRSNIFGDKIITVDYKETEISTYKNISSERFIFCDASQNVATEIVVPKNAFKLRIGSEEREIESNVRIPVQVKTEDIKEIIVRDYYARHFDEIIELVEDKSIYLAKFHIVNNKSHYFIEDFVKHPFKQYIYSNDLLRLLHELNNDSFKTAESENDSVQNIKKSEKNVESKMKTETVEQSHIMTGVERINLGFNAKPGHSYCSYEFAHGLGTGNIGVTAAVVNTVKSETTQRSLLIFGDKGIFPKEGLEIEAPDCFIAALIDPAKGTMRLGVRLKDKTMAQYVDVRWWAFRPFESVAEKEDLAFDKDVELVITPNTINAKPLEQVRLEARINGLNDQRIRWEMAEKNSGSIDGNGLYTAPAIEGVYEIKAFSVKKPEINGSAYVVVSAIGK